MMQAYCFKLIARVLEVQLLVNQPSLSGNAVYGHSIMDKEKHTRINFCDIEKASKSINDPFFMDLEEFDNETFEV